MKAKKEANSVPLKQQIKAALDLKSMTQMDLANVLGVSLGTLINKMSGKTQFSIKEATIICRELDLQPSIFF